MHTPVGCMGCVTSNYTTEIGPLGWYIYTHNWGIHKSPCWGVTPKMETFFGWLHVCLINWTQTVQNAYQNFEKCCKVLFGAWMCYSLFLELSKEPSLVASRMYNGKLKSKKVVQFVILAQGLCSCLLAVWKLFQSFTWPLHAQCMW